MILAAVMLLGVGLWSCERDDDNNSTSGGNNGGGGQTPTGWVDLGLPSGLLWAECNVGATIPEEYGDYYAWGETATKSTYNWITYAYGNDPNQLTKYCSNADYGHNGFTDNLTTLQPGDDAATVNMGNGARTPTADEWRELENNTTSTWTTLNGVYGRKLMASNGKSIFLPAAGYRLDDELYVAGRYGGYWSSSLDAGNPCRAWLFYFHSSEQFMNYYNRCRGLPVRAVRQN